MKHVPKTRFGTGAVRLTLLVASLFAVASCSNGGLGGLTGKKKDSAGSENPDGSGVDGSDENKRATKSLGASGNFQVKSVELLRNSVNSCMGEGMLDITEDMIISETPVELADGKKAFLNPGRYEVGKSIIDQVAKDLVDLTRGNRTGIVADGLSASYLQALETVANVVAHHCDLEKEECQCETTEKSREIIKRCLPSMDPNTVELEKAAEMLGLVCNEGDIPGFGMRKAIASLLSFLSVCVSALTEQ